MTKLLLRYRELITYCMIGCTGATLDFIIYTLCVTTFNIHYQLANLIGVSFGIVNNFFLNYFFNFKVRNHIVQRLLSFYFIGMFGWVLSAILLYLLIECIACNVFLAKIFTIGFVTIVQFLLNKFVTFKKRG